MRSKNAFRISAVVMIWLTAALMLFGQAGRGGIMRVLPIMTALDADRNGEISAKEIEDAVAALKKLDKNKDDKLTAEELRPDFGANRSGRGGSGIPDEACESEGNEEDCAGQCAGRADKD